MSGARDRYDPGKGKTDQHATDKRALYVKWGTQRECEKHTLTMAIESPDRHVPGTLAHALVAAYVEARDE